MSLKVKNISKKYGDKLVVDNVSFSLNKPGVLGLLGTNGAGKTTIIRIILNILSKNSGEVTFNSEILSTKNANIGYLPEERGLYPKTKIYDQLMYFASLKNLDIESTKKEIDYWFDRLNIKEYLNMMPSQLSKGNSQKVQLVISLLGNPQILILDEPFSGLDPVNTETLKDVMKELLSKEKYIIFCSHQMNMVENFCTDIVIINKGKKVLDGNLKKIKNDSKTNKILLEVSEDITSLLEDNKYAIVSNNDLEYVINLDDNSKESLLNLLVKNNVLLDKFEVIKPSLQEIFVNVVKDEIV